MKVRVLLAGAAAAAALVPAAPASADHGFCVTWGGTVTPVPKGICLPVHCELCDLPGHP